MSAVVGRRVGGGFEIESIVAAQREDAQRIQMRREMDVKIKAEQAALAMISEGSGRVAQAETLPVQDTGDHDAAPQAVSRLPLNVPRPKIQKQLIDHVAPTEIKEQQRKRQACSALGFPGLWSYSQTRIACEELSRGIGEMALVHGGDKVFPSPTVLQAYKDMRLSCLHDPLLVPMVSRLQLHHDRLVAMRGNHTPEEAGSNDGVADTDATSNHVGTGGEDDDRVGVERFALPPNELKNIDPLGAPPLVIPMLECLETVLAYSTLSTAAERRAMRSSPLHRLHHRRSASLYSVLLPECAERMVQNVIHPTSSQQSHDFPVCDVIQILFWYVYCAFFLHDEVEPLARRMFPRLSEALLAVHLNSVALRHHRLGANGAPDGGEHSTVGVVEHANNLSEPLDFLNFVIVHTVCYLFPVVFPASHDLFTVDFFDRSSILMNLILNGGESDAQYWRCIRNDFFSAPETSIEGIANAAELARSESDRLLQHYQDDVAQFKRMKDNLERRMQERTASMLRALDNPHGQTGSADVPPGLAHKESIARRQEKRTPFITRTSSIYCPPLDSIELGDPEFHLLNDAVFDAEYAQDLIRGRMQQGAARRSAPGALPAFDPRNREEASRFFEAQAKKKYIGHRAVMRVATFLDVKERYHPSVYSAEHRVAQSIMEKDMNTLRQHIAEGEGGSVPSVSSSMDADNSPDQPASGAGHSGGFVVRFSPLGIRCSESAEAMARQYRTICSSSETGDQSTAQRSRSPLHCEDATSDTYLGMQLSLFNGPPNVTQATSLTQTDVQTELRDRRGASLGTNSAAGRSSMSVSRGGNRRLSDAISIDSIDDPTIEDVPSLNISRTSPRFGEVLFGKRVKSMVSIKSPDDKDDDEDKEEEKRVRVVDEEASCAVTDLTGAMFPREMTRPYDIDDHNDRIVPGLEEASHVSAVGRGKQVGALGEEAVIEKEKDAPLALKSFLSFKRHESGAYSAASKRPLGQIVSLKPSASQLQRSGTSMNGTSLSLSLRRSPTPIGRSETKRSSAASSPVRQRPVSSPTKQAREPHRRSATPSSRPNGTLVSSLNVVAGSPTNAAVAPQATKSNSQWLSMTNTVLRTQKFIDDAVRIHNAQHDIKDMVQDQFERRRSTTELRQRAMNKTFEDEMIHLKTRMEDPLQRTMLVNDWIAREPARRNPDRDKHAAMLRGTLLAEEAQHTSLLVREGLKNLELTFARRRRQSRKMR